MFQCTSSIQAMKSQKMKAKATYRNTLDRNCSCCASGESGAGAEIKRVIVQFGVQRSA